MSVKNSGLMAGVFLTKYFLVVANERRNAILDGENLFVMKL